jgi:hypothetical protein
MARKPAIPTEFREEAEKIVAAFNRKTFRGSKIGYSVRFRGKFLYLDRNEYGDPSPICRLEFNGGMDNWGFAIYKYSDNHYDPEEWSFPGSGEIDGTVEGAMKAGLNAYPL